MQRPTCLVKVGIVLGWGGWEEWCVFVYMCISGCENLWRQCATERAYVCWVEKDG